jgi:uncharacterized membrane protein
MGAGTGQRDAAMGFDDIVEAVGKGVDGAGVAVIGAIAATVLYLLRREPGGLTTGYRIYRQRLGRVILLGLEVLVAGDIIRTVAGKPTFATVGVLAIIVAIRTFLSLELELEIEGRFPWQPRYPEDEGTIGAQRGQ